MLLFIRGLSGNVVPVTVSPYETVLSVKNRLFQLKGIDISQQHLIYGDIELPNSTILTMARIGHGALLRLVLSLHSGPLNLPVSNSLGAGIHCSSTARSQLAALTVMPVLITSRKSCRKPAVMIPLIRTQDPQHPLLQANMWSTGCFEYWTSFNDNVSDIQRKSAGDEDVSRLAEILGYAIDANELTVMDSHTPATLNSSEQPHRSGTFPTSSLPTSTGSHQLKANVSDVLSHNALDTIRDCFGSSPSVQMSTISGHAHTWSHLPQTKSFNISQIPSKEERCTLCNFGEMECVTHVCNRFAMALSNHTTSSLPIIWENAKSSQVNSQSDQIVHKQTDGDDQFSGHSCTQHIISTKVKSSTKDCLALSHIQSLNDNMKAKYCYLCGRRTRPARGFACRCERWFCTKHHHPEDHCCDFDFKVTANHSR